MNKLARDKLGPGELAGGERAFRRITETAARVLKVGRASIWRLVDGGAALACVDLFDVASGEHREGPRIAAADAPRFFAALERERVIRVDDARSDPRIGELRPAHLEPFGVVSRLDAPVLLRGRMVGVVCHEHLGRRRRWKPHEVFLASGFADGVALALEAAAAHQAEAALRETEASLRALVDYSPIATVLTRMGDHRVVLANRRAARLFEVPLDAIQGRHAPDHWVLPADRGRYLQRLLRHGRVDDMDVQLRTHTGRQFWARVSGQLLKFDGDQTLLGTVIDITAERQDRETLRELAMNDPLTGLFNRRRAEEELRKELDRADRHARPLTLAMMDADHFKRVNDGHGHQAGDEVLRAIARRCQTTLRSHDFIGRYGGEEFVIVFPETTLVEAAAVAQRLRAAVGDDPIAVGDARLTVTVSIGLAQLTPGEGLEKLFRRADSALYRAKQDGRNLVRT